MSFDYDVISIGAGSGGCASAMRSADLGKKVALVEYREKGTGGTCVNRGCIPTKVLVKSAQVYSEIKEAKQYGILVGDVKADQNAIQMKKQAIVNNLKFGLDNFLLKSRKVDRIAGKAKFLDAHTLEITNGEEKKTVTAQNIIIATGSEPAMIPAFNIDREKIITSDEALSIKDIPKELIVVGAGALGLEFAYIFSTFGAKVTIAEMMPNVVPILKEKEVTDVVEQYLKKTGIDVRCGSGIASIQVNESGRVVCAFQNGESVEADMALVAIGRSLNTKDMGLEQIGVELNAKGQITINEKMQTTVENVYAVGDIVAGPQLSHKAQKQGLAAAENIAGTSSIVNMDVIPWAIFMQPEIAERFAEKCPLRQTKKQSRCKRLQGLLKSLQEKTIIKSSALRYSVLTPLF